MTLLVVLLAAAVGALALARQRPIVPPQQPPPPAWSLAGHDGARTGHSLSNPALVKGDSLTLRWRRAFAAPPLPARPPVVDGHGNVYVPRADGALLSLDSTSNGETRWCAAVQPITDTACAGPQPLQGQMLPPPVAPNVTIAPDNSLYVVDGTGELSFFPASSSVAPASSMPLWREKAGLIPGDGIALSPDGGTLYGVVAGPARSLYTVAARRPRRQPATGWGPAPGWRPPFIPALRFSPVSVAPDGTPLVAATALDVRGDAVLYAFDTRNQARGRGRWHVALAPGRPTYAAIEPTRHGWIAWIAVSGPVRSWIVLVDNNGRVLWRWSTLHHIDTKDGGVALSLASSGCLSSRAALGYVSTEVGIYAIDRRIYHPWLFFDTRRLGAGEPGALATDVCGDVYVATSHGAVYALVPSGRRTISPLGQVRWAYATGRDARGALALDPHGAVLVASRDVSGTVVLESLGAGPGAPLATPRPGATAIPCADADCPTITPAPSATATITPTMTATASFTATATILAPSPSP